MISLPKFIFSCIIIFLVKPTLSQQSYDSSNCDSLSQVQGSNYLCRPRISDCGAYIVYRAQENFDTISLISSLFNLNQSILLFVNKMAEDDSNWSLPLGKDIIIPITCHCLGGFSKFIFMYNMSKQDSFASVACKVFAGLVKVQSLIEENADFDGHDVPVGSLINVPIRCACPDSPQTRNGVKYLVTYPILEKDIIEGIASKFGLPEKDIRDANNLRQYEAIFPLTTLLVPAKDVPEVRWRAGSLPGSSPAPRAVIPLEKVVPGTKSTKWNLHVFLGVGVSAAVVMMMVTCGLLIICIRCHPRRFQPSTPRSSVSSNVSPDFLDGMSKLKQSLINFSLEELRIATEDFNEASKIGVEVYRGRIGGYYLAIEQMESEEGARRVIYILTKVQPTMPNFAAMFDMAATTTSLCPHLTTIGRLMDDVKSHKFEQERGHAASGVECYIRQYGLSEQEVYKEFHMQVVNAWKDINEESLKPTAVPMPLLERILNLSRVIDVIYKEEDGYTHVGKVMKNNVASLLIDSVPI